MRWLIALVVVGIATSARADGCAVTTPSGQVLFVREITAGVFGATKSQLRVAEAPPIAAPPTAASPTPKATEAATAALPRNITGATLGQFISDPLRGQFGFTLPLRSDQLRSDGLRRFGERPVRAIVVLELLIDDCASTDA